MPVLPEVASTIVVRPGSMRPSASAASIIATPILSFTLPAGLYASSFAISSAPQSGARRVSRTSGVPPTRSARLSGSSGVVRARLMVERLLAGRELEVVLVGERAGLAEAHDDPVVRLHHVVLRVALDLLAVHPGLEHQALAGVVAAELELRERDVPHLEELAELERVGLHGLHVDHARVVVRVQRRDELAGLVDPDVRGHLLLVAVGVDREVGVDVEDRVARVGEPERRRALLEALLAAVPRPRRGLGLRRVLREGAGTGL